MEQLNRIYSVLGTPNEDVWPGVGSLPNARGASQLPHHSGEQNLTPLRAKLGAQGELSVHKTSNPAATSWHSMRGCLPQFLTGHPPADYTRASGVELLRAMLTLDPSKRITAKAALRHPYFHDIQSVVNQMSQLPVSSQPEKVRAAS
eukprot:1145823-Pelagomonas_calceolata.AAC.8